MQSIVKLICLNIIYWKNISLITWLSLYKCAYISWQKVIGKFIEVLSAKYIGLYF